MSYEANLKHYDALVAKYPRFKRKGKANPYTSANGYMFSLLNKDGEFGIRFSKQVQERYIKELDSDYIRSYGAIMQGYVKIPDALWKDTDKLVAMLNESYDYVMSLEPK